MEGERLKTDTRTDLHSTVGRVSLARTRTVVKRRNREENVGLSIDLRRVDGEYSRAIEFWSNARENTQSLARSERLTSLCSVERRGAYLTT